MDVEIRSARSDDAPFLGRVCLIAGRSHCQRGLWDVILGKPELECLAFLEQSARTVTRHPFHYMGFIVAEVDGHPVAALSGYDPKELGHESEESGCFEAGQRVGITVDDWKNNQKGISTIYAVRPDDAAGAQAHAQWASVASTVDHGNSACERGLTANSCWVLLYRELSQ